MKLADLKLNPDNPRNIKPEKLDKLAQSIKDFPKMMVKRPIVYDENKIIIGGNMRYKAIEKLGMTEIPDEWTSDASDFTPEERKRFIMQDNAEMGEHDWDMVANQYELEDLDAWGIDVPYADTNEEVEEDEAPEVESGGALSVLGAVYQLGRHKVMCGDSTDKASVELLMNGNKADMVFTDPPYGIDANKMTMGTGKKQFHRGDTDWDNEAVNVSNLLNMADKVCIWGGNYFADQLPANNDWLCWHKKNDGLSFSEFELAWTNFGKNTRMISHHWGGEEKQHITMKPVQVCAWAIQIIPEAKNIVDVYLGSGSTLIACEQTDRTCYGMELDPKYVDVIRKRYAKFISPDNTLPDNWEELTPEIAREKRGE